LIKKQLIHSVKEIPCLESDRVVGVEVKTSRGNLYIFGVYMPADNNVDCYTHEMNTVESLYNYYSVYGDVIIAGNLNSSCITVVVIIQTL
jgi:hypothetical protein